MKCGAGALVARWGGVILDGVAKKMEVRRGHLMKMNLMSELDATSGRRQFWGATTASRKARAGSVPELTEEQQMGLCDSA